MRAWWCVLFLLSGCLRPARTVERLDDTSSVALGAHAIQGYLSAAVEVRSEDPSVVSVEWISRDPSLARIAGSLYFDREHDHRPDDLFVDVRAHREGITRLLFLDADGAVIGRATVGATQPQKVDLGGEGVPLVLVGHRHWLPVWVSAGIHHLAARGIGVSAEGALTDAIEGTQRWGGVWFEAHTPGIGTVTTTVGGVKGTRTVRVIRPSDIDAIHLDPHSWGVSYRLLHHGTAVHGPACTWQTNGEGVELFDVFKTDVSGPPMGSVRVRPIIPGTLGITCHVGPAQATTEGEFRPW
ncbi:MAG: hypothetical protein IPJ34_42735 [Myxococcales bacterium]|nr:hypothetical protein [Myxococcales bacterium]